MGKLVFLLFILVISCTYTGQQALVEEFVNNPAPNFQNYEIKERLPFSNKVQQKSETFEKLSCGNNVCETAEDEYNCSVDCLVGPNKIRQVEECFSPPQPQSEELIIDESVTFCVKSFNLPKGIVIKNEGTIFDCNTAEIKFDSSEKLFSSLTIISDNVVIRNCNFKNIVIDAGGYYYPKTKGYNQISNLEISNNDFQSAFPGLELSLNTKNSIVKNNNFLNKSGISLKKSKNVKIFNNNVDFIEVLSGESNILNNNFVESFIVLDHSKNNEVFNNNFVGENFIGSITLLSSKENFISQNIMGDGGFKKESIDCNNVLEGMGIPLFPIGILAGDSNVIDNNFLKGFFTSCGIYLDQTKNNQVKNNKIENFDQGILLFGIFEAESVNNTVQKNILDNNDEGVLIKGFVKNNQFLSNSFLNNKKQVKYNTSWKNIFDGNFFSDSQDTTYFIHTITPTYESGWTPVNIEDKNPLKN